MQNIVLNKGIEIDEFHGMDNEECYILSYKDYNWKVSKFVVDVVRILQHTNSLDTLTMQLTEKYDRTELDSSISRTIEFLAKNGLIYGNDVTTQKSNNHIWGRVTLFSKSIVCRIRILCFLFYKPLLLVLSVFSLLWVIYATATTSAVVLSEQIMQLPLNQIIFCYIVMLLIGLLHELGHASALMFYGEKPGRIGFAFYIIFFIMFSDVTNAWKLKRKERLIVDYGGIYFQCIFSGIIYIVNMLWIHNNLLEVVALSEAIFVLGNFNPFFKYDGYWMLSDILGTTNVISIVKSFWQNVFNRKKRCNKSKILSMKVKLIIIFYTICSIVYMMYFIIFTFSAVTNALNLIYFDINFALNREIIVNVTSVFQYISSRFSTYLLLILVIRLFVKGVIDFLKLCMKRKENYNVND